LECREHGQAAVPEEVQSREQAGGLDGLGGQSEAVDRLWVGMEQRDSSRRREPIAGDQAGQDNSRTHDRDAAPRAVRQPGDEARE
jgi:hypothetical protein